MGFLVDYARSELERLGMDEDGIQGCINKDILEIVEVFEKQDHSGTTASYVISMLERLLAFKPIKPLTGAEDEWGTGVSSDQNNRCSSVFRKPDGTCIDVDGIAVSDNGGLTWFSSGKFRKQVTFPYYPPMHPEKVYIEYTEDVPWGETGDKYDIITDDPERIRKLRERKEKELYG